MRVRASQSAILLIILFVFAFFAFFRATGRQAAATSVAAPATPVVGGLAVAQETLLSPIAATPVVEESKSIPSPTPAAGYAPVLAEANERIRQAALVAAQRRALAANQRQQDDQTGPGRAARVRYDSIPSVPPVAVISDSLRVPILMYHHIADAPADADAVRRDLSVSPAAFTQQMDYLLVNGYHTISLSALVDSLLSGKPLPAKPVVLTFDDGYNDNYAMAYPILRRHGFSGAFFVLTDAVGNPGYLAWDQIVAMDRTGMDIEPHGRNHEDLTAIGADGATWQIAGSRSILEAKLGHPVRFYCYPSGHYSAQTIAILRANGYTAAVTIDYGATHKSSGLFELTRVRVRGGDSLDQFIAKLTTAP